MKRNIPKEQVAMQAGMGDSRSPSKALDFAATLFGPIMAGVADDEWKLTIGKSFIEGMQHSNADQMEEFFAELVKVKRAIEAPQQHRSTRGVIAFYRFAGERGKRPTKAEWRDYILENPKVFGADFPPKNEPQAWTPLYKIPTIKGCFSR
jgi:hypothetical protein